MPQRKKLVFKLPSGKTVPVRAAYRSASSIQKRYRAKAKNSVAKLSRQVSNLKMTQQGALQMDRQRVRWSAAGGPTNVANHPSTLRPICFLHQAISANAQIHSLQYVANIPPVFNTLTPAVVGNWVDQTYPITDSVASGGYGVDPALAGKFDQLQYWSQNQGVQNKYCHTSTLYQFRVTARKCRGYVDVFLAHPKKNFVRSTQQDVTLPNGLAGFTNLSLGSNNQYSINNQYYTMKRLKRHYFNTVAETTAPPAQVIRELQTNPDYDFNLTISNDKSRRVITAPELFTGGVLDFTDIPLAKQDWIIVSCTLEQRDVNDNNHVEIDMFRTPRWRDLLGASS
ncbi:MAG: hypothetical protein [Circular genetic element sp.]|nr:MAG: hypothetical protein [Circular genetic element sp.]